MDDKIRIVALGGLDEDGKNCILVDVSGDLYVVGCGIRYPDRTMPGIDYVIPNFDYLRERKKDVKAYFLLQGHEDDMGAIAYIYQDVPAPVYASQTTIAMLKAFTKAVSLNPEMYDFRPTKPTSTFEVGGRKVTFFHTAHNIADSSGLAISTSLGNIVITGDFVVENNAKPGFLHDMEAVAKLAEEKTLVLLAESKYADKPGYTAPHYKLAPLVERTVKDASGRVFVALFSSNSYNIAEVLDMAVSSRKKVIPYDKETQDVLATLHSCGHLLLPKENQAPLDDVRRLRDDEEVILMLGVGQKLYSKIALLAAGQNEDKRLVLGANDTFIVAAPSNDNTELEFTDAVDELYRTGAKIVNLSRKQLLKMHASEEDLKMMIGLLKPRYYIPVKGFYKDLLDNAEVALSMGIKLNHQNVFLLENGNSVLLDQTGGRLVDEGITHGDIMIDGIGVGDVGSNVLSDRQKLAEGVVILGVTVSRSKKAIVAGPDVQMRGFVYTRDAEAITREVNKIFLSSVKDGLEDKDYKLETMKQTVYERCLRAIRRSTGKEPMVLPLIIEVA